MNPLRLQCGTLVILLFALLLLPSLIRARELAITPLAYTAYLGQPAVRFHCSATNVFWRVDDAILGSRELQDRGIETVTNQTTHKSILIISSTLANSNTSIKCNIVHDGSIIHAEATFQVQGVLGKCHDLQITSFGNYHQRLTWDPPSTLNITAVEPDISSYIVCSNISTECTTINVTEAGGDSQDLRQYKFPNLHAYINFTVTAVNIVGDGESASIVSEPCEHTEESALQRFAAQDLSAVVTFDSNNTPSLTVEVMASQRQCFDVYLVHFEEVTGSEEAGLYVIESNWIVPSDDISGNGKLTMNVITNSTLSANMLYQATLFTAMNMTEAGSFQFSTYDVQDVELHGGRENISIRCVFASGSQARGCHVMIRNISLNITMNITRNGSSQSHIAEQTVTGLTPGSYEVFIFDWESNDSFALEPSYEDHVNVTIDTATVGTTSATQTTKATPTTPDVVGNQPQPMTVENIAAIAGAGAGLLLLLVLVIIMVLVIRCTRRKRRYTVAEKRHKELKDVDVKEWEKSTKENDYKDRIYDLPVQPKKQPRVKRLDSTVPLLDSNPLYDLPSPLTTPTCTTFTARDSSETSSQPQSPDGVHMYDTADHSLHAANLRKSGANSPSQASSSSTSEVQPTVTSPHLYTKPSKKKKPARKPTTTTTDSPSVTDGDSGRETMSPDQQLTGDENSDLTPPLPPRNYVNVDVDTMPPSGSDEKIAGTSEQPQERKSSSCVLLLEAQTGNTSDNLPCQNGAVWGGYSHLQHMYPPNISIISVDSDLYSELQDPPPVMGVMDNSTGHIYQVLNQQSVTRDDNEYTIPQDSTSDIPGQTSSETSDMKVDVGPPLEIQDQQVQCNKVCS